MNEQKFEVSTTNAQNKEGRLPPHPEWAGFPAAGLCDDNDFCLAHFLDGVARSLAAHTAGLDASIGHVVSPVARYFVDVHSAEVEPLRCIERCLQITGEDTGL